MIKTRTHRLLKKFAQEEQSLKKSTLIKRIVLLFITFSIWGVIFFSDMILGAFAGIFILFFILIFWAVIGGGPSAKLAKIKHLTDLITIFKHDLFPNAKISYLLDTTPYNLTTKRTWSGRSMHGNSKYKYTDDWLSLKIQLLDQSKIHIRRRTKHKVRKSVTVKVKYFLIVTFEPNPTCYTTQNLKNDVHLFQKMAEKKLFDLFPEETLQAWAYDHTDSDNHKIKVKIVQEERDYTAQEVVDIVSCLFGHMYTYMRMAS